MKNDKFVVMYCNTMIGSFEDLKSAIDYVETLKRVDFYLQKNEFSIHIKIDDLV